MQAVPQAFPSPFPSSRTSSSTSIKKKKERKRRGKEKKGKEGNVRERTFQSCDFRFSREQSSPYSKIQESSPCKGSTQSSGILYHSIHNVWWFLRRWILLGSVPENNHRWCKPFTHLRRCSPTLTVHGCNKVLRSKRCPAIPLWALISLWVISLWLQFHPLCTLQMHCALHSPCLLFPYHS